MGLPSVSVFVFTVRQAVGASLLAVLSVMLT